MFTRFWTTSISNKTYLNVFYVISYKKHTPLFNPIFALHLYVNRQKKRISRWRTIPFLNVFYMGTDLLES